MKGQPDYEFVNRFTHNGVMLFKPSRDELGISVWYPLEFLNQHNDLEYSLRWVYAEGVPMNSFTLINSLVEEKPDLKKIEDHLESQGMFPLNMLFATSDGDHGYHMTGTFPKRKYNVGHGVYPKKGWLKENQWEGIVPKSEHPRIYNPESGIIVSANNFATSKNCKNGITHAFSFT